MCQCESVNVGYVVRLACVSVNLLWPTLLG